MPTILLRVPVNAVLVATRLSSALGKWSYVCPVPKGTSAMVETVQMHPLLVWLVNMPTILAEAHALPAQPRQGATQPPQAQRFVPSAQPEVNAPMQL